MPCINIALISTSQFADIIYFLVNIVCDKNLIFVLFRYMSTINNENFGVVKNMGLFRWESGFY